MSNAASASHLSDSTDSGLLQQKAALKTNLGNEAGSPIEQQFDVTLKSSPPEMTSNPSSLPADSRENADARQAATDSIKGVLLGLTAATGYSIANLALRKLATGEGGFYWDVWISGTKAVPTFIVAG